MPVLIGAFVAVLGVGAAVGIVLGTSGDEPRPSPRDLPTAAPSLAVPTPGPIASIGPGPTSQGGPTPSALVATPHPDPTPAPTTGAGGSQVVSMDAISITVPADWEANVYDVALSVRPTVGGILYLQSEILPNETTAAAILQDDIASMRESYPDLQICRDEQDVTLPNGPAGRSVTLCFTAGTQSGKAYAATNYVAAATITSGQDTILFYLSIFAADTEWNAALEAVIPVLASVNWKKY